MSAPRTHNHKGIWLIVKKIYLGMAWFFNTHSLWSEAIHQCITAYNISISVCLSFLGFFYIILGPLRKRATVLTEQCNRAIWINHCRPKSYLNFVSWMVPSGHLPNYRNVTTMGLHCLGYKLKSHTISFSQLYAHNTSNKIIMLCKKSLQTFPLPAHLHFATKPFT